MTEESSMGSLAQAARGNQLKSARWIMIVVGILTVGINGVMLPVADKQLDDEVKKLQSQGYEIDQGELDKLRSQNRMILGVGLALGVVFIGLGIMVYQFPVPCTVGGLVLYIIANLGFAALDPMSLARGIIIKIFIVVGLVKSVKSAFAYEAEKNASPVMADIPSNNPGSEVQTDTNPNENPLS